jgi:hypothetical protein
MFIPPAVAWIRFAGSSLYQLCQNRAPRSATLSTMEDGCAWLWMGDVGFSPGRWKFWKQRFGEIAVQGGLDEHLQILAREAEERMENIEG